MMRELKLGCRLLRYGYGLKTVCILAVVFLGCGIAYYVMGLTGGERFTAVSGVMLVCVAMLPTQVLQSLNVTSLVQASPAGKRMQTAVPAVVSCAGMIVAYLTVVLIRSIEVWGHPEGLYTVCNELLLQAACSMGIMIYMGIGYKYFVASSLLMVPFLWFVLLGGSLIEVFSEENTAWGGMAFGAAVLLGAAVVLLGGVFQYLLSLLLYRVPVSKIAQTASLRKQL